MRRLHLFSATFLLCAAALNAGQLTVTLDTSKLVANAAGPFSAAFQVADGSLSGDGNNAVVVSNIRIDGQAMSSDCAPTGEGNLATSVSLTDLNVFGTCRAAFTAGNTLTFDVSYTNNVDGSIPDEFIFSILNANSQALPTTGGTALVEIDFDSSNPTIQRFAGDTGATGGIGLPLPDLTNLSSLPAPVLVAPADEANNAPRNTKLIWDSSIGATSYDVYFGTSSTPPMVTNVTGTTYTPAALSYDTTYYWKIVAKNGSTSTPSGVFSFHTAATGGLPVSVSPSSGSSGRQLFTFTARDVSGFESIQYAQFLFSRNGINALNACYVSYDPVANVFYLLSDDETQWYGLFGGDNKTTGNAQCTIWGATSGVTKSGTDVVVHIDMSFRSGFAGSKNIYQFVGDTAGGTSGWTLMGTHNDTGDPSAVEVTSYSPNSGSGASQTFTAVVHDGDGANTIAFAQFVMNGSLNGYNGCFIHYDRASNVFFLLNDSGTDWFGMFAGTATQVSNSQCTLHGSGSNGTVSGSNLTITYQLDFAPSFSGPKVTNMQAVDNTGVIEVWHQVGTWTR